MAAINDIEVRSQQTIDRQQLDVSQQLVLLNQLIENPRRYSSLIDLVLPTSESLLPLVARREEV